MMGWDLALVFLRKWWPFIVGGLAVAGAIAVVYWEGGRGPRAELAAERAERAKAEDEFELTEIIHEERSDALVKDANEFGVALATSIQSSWQGIADGLEKQRKDADHRAELAERRMRDRDGGGDAAEPVRRTPGGPDDPAGDDRLPDAVERYVAEVRSILGRERAETAGLLEACEQQTGALTIAQKWAADEREVNRYDRPLLPAESPAPE